MDNSEPQRELIRKLITAHTQIPYAHGDIQFEPVFDTDNDRYLLMIVGRDNDHRVHGCLIHVDIINGKFWIQRDGTEQGIANELVEAGIPKDHIVLAFRSEEMRKHTKFAPA